MWNCTCTLQMDAVNSFSVLFWVDKQQQQWRIAECCLCSSRSGFQSFWYRTYVCCKLAEALRSAATHFSHFTITEPVTVFTLEAEISARMQVPLKYSNKWPGRAQLIHSFLPSGLNIYCAHSIVMFTSNIFTFNIRTLKSFQEIIRLLTGFNCGGGSESTSSMYSEGVSQSFASCLPGSAAEQEENLTSRVAKILAENGQLVLQLSCPNVPPSLYVTPTPFFNYCAATVSRLSCALEKCRYEYRQNVSSLPSEIHPSLCPIH